MKKNMDKDSLNVGDLAFLIRKKCDNRFYCHEILDVLEMMQVTIEEALAEGKQVKLRNIGTIKPEFIPAHSHTSNLKGPLKYYRSAGYRIRFIVSQSMKSRLKKRLKEMSASEKAQPRKD